MAEHAVVVGSGAGGSVAALELARAGWDVTVLEKGPDRHGLLGNAPSAVANDEVAARRRWLLTPDPLAWPRTYRTSADDTEPTHVGNVDELPQVVGGGTAHWDAKTPRFWDIDFAKRSLLGPVDDADVRDWPFTYQELAPFYDEVEQLYAIAGDVQALPELTRRRAPRHRPFPLPPGPPQRASLLLADGAAAVGWTPYPVPMGMSRAEGPRPACNDCGFCGGYGCPIGARAGALDVLRAALDTGRVDLQPRTSVVGIEHTGGRAQGVSVLGEDGARRAISADLVVLAASAIESSRLALLSDLPDPSGWLGRGLLLHWFTAGYAIWLDERVQVHGGRSTTHAVDDLCDPELPLLVAAAREAGLPYVRGGVLELGGVQHPVEEAATYVAMLGFLRPQRPFGTAFKDLMRASLFRERMAGLQMIGEDLPQPSNTVDLDPHVTDHHGVPVARVTYAPHRHELVAQSAALPALERMLTASGAHAVGVTAQTRSAHTPHAPDAVPAGFHVLGGLRMGDDPRWSVTDEHGRYRGVDGLVVADGSVFPTSGAHNPTLTIVAVALRNARAWARGA